MKEDFKEHKISNPKGLMLDNLVYNRHGEVVALRSRDFMAWFHPQMGGDYGFYAIPLTEEWLKKAGFEFQESDDPPYELYVHKEFDRFEVWEMNGEHWIVDALDQLGFDQSHFKYLHQLQNYFYAFTNSELKINQ